MSCFELIFFENKLCIIYVMMLEAIRSDNYACVVTDYFSRKLITTSYGGRI